MSHRRKTAFASSAIVLASVLSSCGFDTPTDRDYPVATGAEDRTQEVDVLSGHVVTDIAGRGVVVATLNNGSQDEEISLTGVTSDEVDVAPFEAIPVGKRKAVNLADAASELPSIQVTDPGQSFESFAPKAKPSKTTEATPAAEEGHDHEGHDHAAGEEHAEELATSGYDADLKVVGGKFVRVTMQFSNGEAVNINLPVVRNCGYFAETPGVNAGPKTCPSGNDLKQESHH